MKKYFITIVMAMVMMFALTCPVHALCDDIDNSINKRNKGTIIQGDGNIVSKNNKGIINTGDVGCDNGAVVGGDIDNSSKVIIKPGAITAKGGNATIEKGAIKNNNHQKQQQGQFQIAEGGKGGKGGKGGDASANNEGVSAEANNEGVSAEANNEGVSADNSNDQTVNIESPDEIKVNSQLSPMAGQQVDTIEYHGETLEDHKYQDEILQFVLAAEGPKPFKVKEHGLFTRKSAHSASKDLSVTEYPETTTVYAFRDMADLKANIKNYSIVGYADTFSKGKATLMDCFDQGVIDSGEMGGNILVLLDVGYINALKSATTGLGGSGATGLMKGANQSSVFGAALGYASSKATPETDPFIHGMILYSAELSAEN